jgi:hypothetical protein
MFNPTAVVIDAFVDELRKGYTSTYTNLEPDYPGIIDFVGHMALELIANSDAPYHDLDHTICVTLVGQEVIRGKHLREGGVSPRDWLHFIISLLCHDIGYVRGICRDDRQGQYVTGKAKETVELPEGATDASLTPYHIERGKLFVRERFAKNRHIEVEVLCANIEYTRFPVPHENESEAASEYPALLRASDLIGQLADLSYMRKISALFTEFEETGMNKKLGYGSSASLRAAYPKFFWSTVTPYIGNALSNLRMTQEGKLWIANLYSHVFAEEHKLPTFGAERMRDSVATANPVGA